MEPMIIRPADWREDMGPDLAVVLDGYPEGIRVTMRLPGRYEIPCYTIAWSAVLGLLLSADQRDTESEEATP